MKILGYISGFDGCGLFRLQIPFKYLNKIPNVTARISFKYDKEELEWADIIIIQKQYQDSVFPYIEIAKSLNKPVILEFDDLMTEIPEWNSAHSFYKDKKEKIINFIKNCDACTVTTDYLRKVNLALNPNIFVLPNSMDIEQIKNFSGLPSDHFYKYIVFKDPKNILSRNKTNQVLPQDEVMRKLKGKLKIMWWGSPTHREDLKIVDKTLALLAHENPELIIMKVGCCTAEFLDYMKDIPDQLVIVDPIAVNNFHGVLHTLIKIGPTISVCPIVELPFNRAKSNLKVIESFALKASVIASKVENYSKTITHGINGYLCSNDLNSDGIAEDWYKHLKLIIQNPIQQGFLAENGYLTALKDYNISNNVNLWMNAYNSVLNIK
jgi:glycosyltransferase involved in cell wall biosynthesis